MPAPDMCLKKNIGKTRFFFFKATRDALSKDHAAIARHLAARTHSS